MSYNIKPETLTSLSHIYGISVPTMVKWLKPIGDKIGKKNGIIFTQKQVKIIIEHLGEP